MPGTKGGERSLGAYVHAPVESRQRLLAAQSTKTIRCHYANCAGNMFCFTSTFNVRTKTLAILLFNQ